MKKKICLILLCLISVLACAVGLAACGDVSDSGSGSGGGNSPSEHEHIYDKDKSGYQVKVQEATCSHPDIYALICLECGAMGDTFEYGEPNPEVHSYSEYNLKSEATCTKPATYSFVCDECDKHGIVEYGKPNPKAHDFSAEVAEPEYLREAATCYRAAQYYYSCLYCGESGEDNNRLDTFEYGECADHKFTEKSPDVFSFAEYATCIAPEKYYYTCEWCSEHGDETYEYGKVNSAAHNFSAQIPELNYLKEAATCQNGAEYYYACTYCGKFDEEITFYYGEIGEHKFDREEADYRAEKATCVSPEKYYYLCKWCNKHGEEVFEYGEANPEAHDFSSKIPEQMYLKKTATCQNKATFYYSCSYCAKADAWDTFAYGEFADHKFTREERYRCAERATCIAPAKYYYICEWCYEHGEETFEYGEPNGHSLSELEIIDPATTEKAGIKAKVCSECNGKFETICYVKCSKCEGLGKIIGCNYCTEGYVNKKCSTCYGIGKNINAKACELCGGKGQIATEAGFVTCSNCLGICFLPCRSCLGRGCATCYYTGYYFTISDIDCSKCKGAGTVKATCSTCKGNWQSVVNTCSQCEGEGKYDIGDISENIADYAFKDCSTLTSIIISGSVVSIGDSAFYGCSSLTTVYYCGTEEDWGKITISSLGNYRLIEATRYYYSETEPTEEGNYWHYDTDGETPVVWS